MNHRRKLKRLNIGGNELLHIPTISLKSSNMPKKLEIQENRIAHIEESIFEGDNHHNLYLLNIKIG